MENEDEIFNQKEEETFSFFTDMLTKLKLKEDDSADKKVENHPDLYSKAHSNLADLELLLMQLKSTSEFQQEEEEADLYTNKEYDIDFKKEPQTEPLIEQSLQEEKRKIEDSDSVANAEENKSFIDIKEAESISFKEEEKFEDVRDTIEENKLALNIEQEQLKDNTTINEIQDVSELKINQAFGLNSKFETYRIDEEIKDQFEEILNLRQEVAQNNEIKSEYKKEEIENNLEDIQELNEDIEFNSCIEIEPIKEESEKEVEEVQELTEEIKSISFIILEPIEEKNNEIEEVSELAAELKLNLQQEIDCNEDEDQRSNYSGPKLVDKGPYDENEVIEIKAEKDETEVKANVLIEEVNISSEEIEAISINEIETDKIEENKIISDSKVEFQNEEVDKIDNSSELKYSVLSEIDISKDESNKQIQEINEEKDLSKEIFKESEKLEIQKIEEENEIFNLKEALPITTENIGNKIVNEEFENKSKYEPSDHKDTIEENPNDRLLQLIAELENNDKPYPSRELKETSTLNIQNLSLVKENPYKASLVHEIPVEYVLVTIEKQEETNYLNTKIEPSCEPDLKDSATFISIQMENVQEHVEAPLDAKETSIISLNNECNEIINEIPRANNQQYISFQPVAEQFTNELKASIDAIEISNSKLQNEPKENIRENPNLLDQLNLIQPDSDLNEIEFQCKPNESFEFEQPIHESKTENVFELAKNAISLEQPKFIDKIIPSSEDKKDKLNSDVPLQVHHDSRIKTPFDDDDDIEEIPEIKYNYQIEDSKCDSSGIVNYQRPSEPRGNILSSNILINEFKNKKIDEIDLLENNHPKLEIIQTVLNTDQRNSKSSYILLENNQPSNNFFNTKTNPFNDPFQLNKSEYSVANSMINNHIDPTKILASHQEITKEVSKEIPQNENNIRYSNQTKNLAYFLADNSGINYNDKSEQIEFDVKDMTTIPEALPESKQQYEVKKENDSFRVGSEFKFSREEIKQSNLTNMSNILAERKLSDLQKPDIKSKYTYENPHDIEIDDFDDFEEVHNLTGNDFNKNESKNKIKSPFPHDAGKYSNIIKANKKNENLNSSNDKSAKEFKQANDKYQNFRTEDYESNNILLELNKEQGSPAPEIIEKNLPTKKSFVNQVPLNGAKENPKIIEDKINIEENKSYNAKERKSILSKNQLQKRPSQDLTIINYFNMKEIKFHESIPNFSSIFLEKNFIFKRRRNSFLNNHYYEEHILKEYNIIDRYKAIPKDFQAVLEEGLKKYEQTTEFQDFFKEAFRNSDLTAEMIKSQRKKSKEDPLIGELKPISIYFEDKECETAESKISFNSLSEAVPYWRESIADGDSFYRAFIFGLLEHYILTNNKREIKKIIFDICHVNEYFSENVEDKSKKVDLTNTLSVFYFILDNLENNDIGEAYQVLTRSYHVSENEFDTKLIDYIRRTIWMNIYETEKEINLKKDYSQEKNAKLEYDPIRIDTILVFQIEPNKLPISLIPLIFNVDLDIYILDGSLGSQSEIKYIKKSFTNYKPVNSTVPTISLFYNLSSYHKAYSKDYFKRNEKLFSPLLKHEDSRADISLGNKLNCEVCILKTDHAIYNKYSNEAFCVECAKAYVNSSLDKRAKIHIIENFHNREYYSRSFKLKEDIFLNDSDIYKLYNTNIANLLLKSIKTLCFFCNIKQENDIHTLSCFCQICSTCLDQILKLFDSIQLSTRKRTSTSKPICACNSAFNVNEAISILSSTDKQSSGKESNRNIDDFISRHCMNCCNAMINKGDEIAIPTSNQVYQKFHIINEDTEKIGKSIFLKNQHVLCFYCIDKIKKQESEENLRRRNSGNKFIINKNHKAIECNICKCNHKILQTDWNRVNKATCCEGCLII